MSAPGWYALIILGLGTYRLCRLIGWDEITAPLRPKLTGLSDAEYSQWTYALNALQHADRDPWDFYYGPGEAQAFLVDVAAGLGIADPDQVTLPPMINDRIEKTMSMRGPSRYGLVPFTRWEWYGSKLIRCPWCLSVYVGGAAWLSWQVWPHATLAGMSIPALWAVAGFLGKLDLSDG